MSGLGISLNTGIFVMSLANVRILDDSAGNCVGARKLGWNTVHLVEGGKSSSEQDSQVRIQRLEELVGIWPEFF